MRIAKYLAIAGVAVVILLVAAAVILSTLDFNEYKQQIADEAKKATGRDLAIEGDLRLNVFTLNPGLAVDGVRFANAPWGSKPDMATIKRFEVKINLLPLLSGTLNVDSVVLSGADILLERNKAGKGNYEFGPAKKAERAKKDGAGDAGQLPNLALHEVSIEDARLTYKDAQSGQTIVLAVEQLTLSGGSDLPLDVTLKGSYNDAPFSVTGGMGSMLALVGGDDPWPLSIKAEAGGATVSVKGKIGNPAAVSGLDLSVSVTGQDLSTLSAIAQAPVPPLGPYSITAKIKGALDKAIEVPTLNVKMGESALAGKATLQLKGRPVLTASLASDLINLSDFVKEPQGGKSADSDKGSDKKPAAGGAADKRVFPADPLPVDGLKAADANVDLAVKKLLANGIPVDDIKVKLRLRNGDLTVKPLAAQIAGGVIDGSVRLNAARGTPALDVAISGKKIDVGKLLAAMDVTDLLQGIVNTDVALKGQGQSVRALMASLNGKTSVVMGKGRMKSDALDIYAGGAAKLLTQIVVGKKSEYTVINCFVNQFDVQKGVAKSNILLFDTEYTTVTGKGSINLGTEEIDYQVDPRPKSVTVNTAVPVQITGMIGDPSISLNTLAAAAKVGGIVGSVFFPPAAIVALGDLGTGDDNPCVKKAGTAGKGGDPKAKPESKGVTDAVKGVGDGVKERLDKGLKGLFGK